MQHWLLVRLVLVKSARRTFLPALLNTEESKAGQSLLQSSLSYLLTDSDSTNLHKHGERRTMLDPVFVFKPRDGQRGSFIQRYTNTKGVDVGVES